MTAERKRLDFATQLMILTIFFLPPHRSINATKKYFYGETNPVKDKTSLGKENIQTGENTPAQKSSKHRPRAETETYRL